MKTRTRLGLVFTSLARFLIVVTLAALFTYEIANAAPRLPQPPWPQQTVRIYGFDAAYWWVPWNDIAVNEDLSTLAESWSGYALLRDGFVAAPVWIPVARSEQERNVAVPYGAVRFWLAPSYSTASEKSGGTGPGHLARWLELVSLDANAAQVLWSLYVNEAGDTVYLSGQTKAGTRDLLSAPVELVAGDWRMVTICYSPTNTALWLDAQLVATGEGLPLPQKHFALRSGPRHW